MQKFLANLNLFIRKSSESKNHMNIFDEQKTRMYKKFRNKIKYKNKEKITKILHHSKSQIFQDIFVLNELNF